MTKKLILKEILKLEKSLLRSYMGLRTEKFRRSNEAYNMMMDIFKEVKSTGKYKTIAKSKMTKSELLNYLEKLQNVRDLESSTVKGWRNIVKQNRKLAKERGIDVDEVEENYDDLMDYYESRNWRESAEMYYDSEELNNIRWLEPSEQYNAFLAWIKEVEASESETFEREHYTKWSEILTPDNFEDLFKAAWNGGRF